MHQYQYHKNLVAACLLTNRHVCTHASHGHTDICMHTHIHTHHSIRLHCSVRVTWPSKSGGDRNSKSRPPHHQGTSGLLVMVTAQPHGNQRTHYKSNSSMHTHLLHRVSSRNFTKRGQNQMLWETEGARSMYTGFGQIY